MNQHICPKCLNQVETKLVEKGKVLRFIKVYGIALVPLLIIITPIMIKNKICNMICA